MTERSGAARPGRESRGGDCLTLQAADVDEREHAAGDRVERTLASPGIDERRRVAVGHPGARGKLAHRLLRLGGDT